MNLEELLADIQDEAHLILELYLRFGEKAFSMLKGMFAIAMFGFLPSRECPSFPAYGNNSISY